jgi:CspA family cold shock protein
MKKVILSLAIALLSSATVFAADMTLQGKITKVETDEKEIHVLADGKKHELHIKDNTELLQNGAHATFDALKVDQKVKVEVKKVGKRLDPIKVEILN